MIRLTLETAKAHIKTCNRFAQKSPQGMLRAFYLAISSMRVQSSMFWPNLADVFEIFLLKGAIQPGGIVTMFHFGHKGESLTFIKENIDTIYSEVMARTPDEAHTWICKNLRGLGPAKAGFIIQLIFGTLGCIDSANMARLGINKAEFNRLSRRKNAPTWYREYLKSEAHLSSPVLWRDWCNYVAKEQNLDPQELSRQHMEFMTGKRQFVLN